MRKIHIVSLIIFALAVISIIMAALDNSGLGMALFPLGALLVIIAFVLFVIGYSPKRQT